MRSREERKADFERREAIRKEKYAAARDRQREVAAERTRIRADANDQPAAEPASPEPSEEQLVRAAQIRLAQPSAFTGEGGSPLMLPLLLREMRQTKRDLKIVRDARRKDVE